MNHMTEPAGFNDPRSPWCRTVDHERKTYDALLRNEIAVVVEYTWTGDEVILEHVWAGEPGLDLLPILDMDDRVFLKDEAPEELP